jgi:hypothetical protein
MWNSSELGRRAFLRTAAAGATALVRPRGARGKAGDLAAIRTQIEKHHDEAVKRLQEWIGHPAIAAEGRGVGEGCDLMIRLAREAGFGSVTNIPTAGVPGAAALRNGCVLRPDRQSHNEG